MRRREERHRTTDNVIAQFAFITERSRSMTMSHTCLPMTAVRTLHRRSPDRPPTHDHSVLRSVVVFLVDRIIIIVVIIIVATRYTTFAVVVNSQSKVVVIFFVVRFYTSSTPFEKCNSQQITRSSVEPSALVRPSTVDHNNNNII